MICLAKRRGFADGLSGLLIIFSLIFPCAIAFVAVLNNVFGIIENQEKILNFLWILSGTSGAFIFLYKIFNKIQKEYVFLSIYLLLSLAVRMIFVLTFDQEFYSDFSVMWNNAVHFSETYNFKIFQDIRGVRTLPYLLPLVLAFGKKFIVIKFFNVFSIIIAGLLLYFLCKIFFNETAARNTLLVYLFIPELFFASIIPSHDIPGALLYLLATSLIVYIFRNYQNSSIKINIALSGGLGLILLLLKLQRGLDLVVFLGLIVFLVFLLLREDDLNLAVCKKVAVLGLLVLVVPFTLVSFGNGGLRSLGLTYKPDPRHRLSIMAAHGNSLSNGSYGYWKKTNDYYGFEKIDEGVLKDFVISRIMSDVYYNFDGLISSYFSKSKRLYNLGSQGGFYYKRLSEKSFLKGRAVINALSVYNKIVVVFLLGGFFVFLLGMILRNTLTCEFFFILYPLAVLSCILLTIAEIQPRYMFPLYFAISLVIGGGLASPRNSGAGRISFSRKGFIALMSSCIPVILILVGCFLAFKLWFSGNDRRFLDFNEWDDFTLSYTDSTVADLKYLRKQQPDGGLDHFRKTLVFPRRITSGDQLTVKKKYIFNDQKLRKFQCFVSSPYFRPEEKGLFEVSILINGVVRYTSTIADKGKAEFVLIDKIDPVNGAIEIEYRLTSKRTSKSKILQNASRVYFDYGRLYVKD